MFILDYVGLRFTFAVFVLFVDSLSYLHRTASYSTRMARRIPQGRLFIFFVYFSI